MTGFRNSIVAGGQLVRDFISSPNFVSGSLGWIIRKDGTAEFSNIIARGTIIASQIKTSALQTVARLWINNPAGIPNQILFYKEDQNDATAIKELSRVEANSNTAQNPGLRLIGYHEESDPDYVGIQVVGGAAGTGVGAIIELVSPDAVDITAGNRELFRINTNRIIDGTDLHAQDVSASGNQTVTNAFVDIAGMAYTFTPDFDCDVAIVATFDELVSVAIGAGGLAIHRCVVDGVAQPRTPYVRADAAIRDMTMGAWVVNGLAANTSHTIKFQVQKSINAGTVTLQSSVTGAALTVMQNGN